MQRFCQRKMHVHNVRHASLTVVREIINSDYVRVGYVYTGR